MGKIYYVQMSECGKYESDLEFKNLSLREARKKVKELEEKYGKENIHWQIVELISIKSC